MGQGPEVRSCVVTSRDRRSQLGGYWVELNSYFFSNRVSFRRHQGTTRHLAAQSSMSAMNRKSPKPSKRTRSIRTLAEEYAEILHLRKQVEAAAARCPTMTDEGKAEKSTQSKRG